MEEEVKELARLLQQSKNIVFFGGAGVSTESGIPDFRSAKGLWNEKLKINFTPEQLVSHTFFMKYPEEFFAFYREKLTHIQKLRLILELLQLMLELLLFGMAVASFLQ